MLRALCCSSSLFMGGACLALFQKVPLLKLKECTVHPLHLEGPTGAWSKDSQLIGHRTRGRLLLHLWPLLGGSHLSLVLCA